MPKQSTAVHPATAWVETLRHKRRDLCEHGLNYAIECLIADAVNLPRPVPPGIRVQQGAINRGKAISKDAARRKKSE